MTFYHSVQKMSTDGMANTIDPYQTAPSGWQKNVNPDQTAPLSDLGSHCLPRPACLKI